MKLDVLVSCMHQSDMSLVSKTRISGDCTMINQCDMESFEQIHTRFGIARMFSTKERGLTKSRNMAISKSLGDICLLCDDDEVLVDDYEKVIIDAYEAIKDADVIAFEMSNHVSSLKKTVQELKFPKTMKISSWQITFRRDKIIEKGIRFDELLGAGTGNGAEEELKFLLDCQKSNLKIYYVPEVIGEVAQTSSTWFNGFDEQFFENRGATTRYILGWFTASIYAMYYLVRKHSLYKHHISFTMAFKSIFKGIVKNKISKQAR
ncbi:MAG: glycosyltransferase family 2 protein [Ruminococcaceae bacterium]|nr:glycosyltransferase family 2 protein [Oscillospiraceae bacterium]